MLAKQPKIAGSSCRGEGGAGYRTKRSKAFALPVTRSAGRYMDASALRSSARC